MQTTRYDVENTSLQSIDVKVYDIHRSILEAPITISDIPNDLYQKSLFSNWVEHPIRLSATTQAKERAQYTRALCEFLRNWTEETLSHFQIPNRLQHQRIEISLEHVGYEHIDALVKRPKEDYDFTILIAENGIMQEPKEGVIIAKWNETEIKQTWSFEILRMFWKEIGRICLQRQYIDSEKHEHIFSDSTFDGALQRPLLYFDSEGRPISPNSRAMFVAPNLKGMFPISHKTNLEVENVTSQ